MTVTSGWQSTQRLVAILLTPIIAVFFLLAAVDNADAKRFGGGKSFGSKPAYERSYTKPIPPAHDAAGSAQRQAMVPNAPGTQSRWGGLLGGLLIGGLLGSLFFGGGFGPGLMDLVLIGGGLYLLVRFLRSRQQQPAFSGPGATTTSDQPLGQNSARAGWDNLGASTVQQGPRLPNGLDEKEFLEGAQAVFTRLQSAWDRRDLRDIRQFAGPAVADEIARQAAEDPTPSKTDVLYVTPKLVEVRQEGQETIASVLFDALMREEADAAAKQVREVWHFSRNEADPKPEWRLEGIQQLEA